MIESYIANDLLLAARKYMTEGTEAEIKQRYIPAKDFYIQAADTLININKCEYMLHQLKKEYLTAELVSIHKMCERSSTQIRTKMIKDIVTKIEEIVTELCKRNILKPKPPPPPPKPPSPTPVVSTPVKSSPYQVYDTFTSFPSFSSITGLKKIKDRFTEALMVSAKFTSLVQPWRTIFIYGPPGTGKSYLASAVAKEALNITSKLYKFLPISAADITSKWVGEGEKNVRILFQNIVEIQPCIVFIDEIDSLCTTRDVDSNESSRRLKTQLLIELQNLISNLDNKYTDVLLVVASNRPYDIDSAFLRRFEIMMEIPIPTIEDKLEHINKWLKSNCDDDDIEEIEFHMNKNLNYSDLNFCFKEAVMRPFRKCINGELGLKLTNDDMYVISTDNCTVSDVNTIPDNRLKIESTLLLSEFTDILKHMKPSVKEHEINQIQTFTNEYEN